jgi:hypothetical protein
VRHLNLLYYYTYYHYYSNGVNWAVLHWQGAFQGARFDANPRVGPAGKDRQIESPSQLMRILNGTERRGTTAVHTNRP